MGKILLMGLFIVCGLSACSQRGETYYATHPCEAKEKIAVCNKIMEVAIKTKNRPLSQKTIEDPECIAARVADVVAVLSWKENRRSAPAN